MLQRIILLIEKLLPAPHNDMVIDILFKLATWHVHAKLCLHMSKSLLLFRQSTKRLGMVVRQFRNTTCDTYHTMELPKEEAARGHREATMSANVKLSATWKQNAAAPRGPKVKKLNLQTYKWHALPDYPPTIERYGTTDNYTSQIVCTIIFCVIFK
ncbi:uncharacterized protein LAESUDRAFT_660039 [Laetiporus sulphureus 93-53]|uniref:Uncharacterized protein n=1 Tax=Laetiporus sulphureus 93-53 TaxID=1314785 RepID=A0A165CS07_9APHY|nr:uncharacterized protein LAESUDRAFT_660039 [Laetiporus sulphureus 93-53]KZT03336.1 hypothetical protein LAESUDRAFT_660039 [Laetiporus sulphureus 93-53]